MKTNDVGYCFSKIFISHSNRSHRGSGTRWRHGVLGKEEKLLRKML
jgi:hypothetical protein